MNDFPCLVRSSSAVGAARFALGDPLVDSYLAFVAGRARPNTLHAVAHDLKTFFTVVAKAPAAVVAADVFEFLAQQRGDRIGPGRALLVVARALPGGIPVRVWVALLGADSGAINRLLGVLGIYPIPWLNDPDWAKVAVLLVNLWLGFPYMMTATLGALSTIPDELYEAAKVDGATPWQALFRITLPLLEKPMLPILLSAFAFNFNNFYLIYLLTGGGPAQEGRLATAQATDILISWAYKTAFSAEGQSAYGLGAAISLIIFAITVAISLVNFRVTGALREVR